MSCAACAHAESAPTSDEYRSGCDSCLARALAATGAHIESRERQAMTQQYRGALEKLFGDRWKAGNEMVKQWAQKIESSNKRKAQPK